ncbi:MAG: dihydrodipicolinate synthase family protein, partial [Eggerthellales bacterium]|nr:dihydrodipicolinate synthase family protein [Eggerthellales bacterium]
MADKSKFQGVIPPVVVPLTADKQLDIPAFEKSINRMIDGGVHGLFFLGSSGEVAFLNDEQRYEVLENAVRIVDHRVPVLAGVIDMETERVIKQIERTK